MLLRTLGTLELVGHPVRRPGLLELLAYLALEGVQERRFLADLFWMDAADPLNRLSSSLSRLRKAAPGAIEADATRVWTPVDTDVARLRAAAAVGDVETALDAYRGPFLADLEPSGRAELDEWLLETREELAEAVRLVHLKAARRDAARERFGAAADHAAAALDLAGARDPTPDVRADIVRLLVAGDHPRADAARHALDAVGGRADATVADAREALRRALEADVDGRADADLGDARRPALPLPATPFVGRLTERRQLAELLCDPTCRLVTIIAPGGMGKTRLALAATESTAGAFPDGVHFVPLAAVATIDALVDAIATAVRLRYRGDRTAREQVCAHLADRELVLVLDSLDHLSDAPALVHDLLERAPGLKVLATSRAALDLQAEWRFELAGLGLPPPAALDAAGALDPDADLGDAMRLLRQAARRVRADDTLDDAGVRALARICVLVEGMPLALELAATWLAVLGPQEVVAEIERGIDVLETDARDVPERQRSMRAVFEASWRQLSAEDQEAFAACCVFRGGFDLAAARAVADAGPGVLRRLANRAFVARRGDRYALHPLLRQFGEEKLRDPTTVRRRHALRFLEMAEGHRSATAGAAAWWRFELENLRAASTTFLALGDTAEALRLATALRPVFMASCRYEEGRRLLEGALTAGAAHAGSHRAAALLALAALTWRMGDLRASLAPLEESLVLYRAAGDRAGTAAALRVLGVHAHTSGAYDLARTRFEESMALCLEGGDEIGVANALLGLGNVAFDRGDAEARGHFERSRAIALRLGDALGAAYALDNLGALAWCQGHLETAERVTDEVEVLYAELDHRFGDANVAHRRGLLALAQGDLAAADAHLRRASSVRERIDEVRGSAFVRHDLARTALAAGAPDAAREHLRLGLDLSRRHGAPLIDVLMVEGVAALQVELGAPGAALELLAACAAWRARAGVVHCAVNEAHYRTLHERIAAALDGDARARIEARGAALGVDAAVAVARALVAP